MNNLKSIILAGAVFLLLTATKSIPNLEEKPSSRTEPAPVTGEQTLPRNAVTIVTIGEEIDWQVPSGGDIKATSATYRRSATMGQSFAGNAGSASYELVYGFWQAFAEGGMCGDANGDETINVADTVYIISYIFKGGPAPDPLCVGDANGDDAVNVADTVYLTTYIFKGGPPPVEDCC